MGDLNGHTGLLDKCVNGNGQLVLDFVDRVGCKIKNWELENPLTWKDRNNESAIDYILENDAVEK